MNVKRAIWLAIGFVAGLLAAVTGIRTSAAEQSDGQRYTMAIHSYGNNNHPVVVVLDSHTGRATPYVIHTNLSLSAGDLRLTPVRVPAQ